VAAARRGAAQAGSARLLTVAILLGTLVAFMATLVVGSRDYSFWADGVLGNLALGLPSLVCLGRAAAIRAQRVPMLLIGLGGASFTAGSLIYVFTIQFMDPLPYPSVSDIGYLGCYPFLMAGLVLLARPELSSLPRTVLMDGTLGALACIAAGSFLTVQPVLASLDGTVLATVVGASYPVADLCVIALVVGVVSLKGGRPGATWVWLGTGAVTFAVADTVFLYRLAGDGYVVGTPLDGLWAAGLTLMAVAATLPYRPGGRSEDNAQRMVLPHVSGAIALGMLVYGSLPGQELPLYAVVLAVLTLGAAFSRVAYGFSVLRMLTLSQRQARTDELTQLPNRRHFYERVQQALAARQPDERFALVMLDLNGFKAINDSFGHAAGDELLRQIGPRLSAELSPGDVLARLGGDEFAVLLRDRDRYGAVADGQRLRDVVQRPFLIEGNVQAITASLGIAECPDDGVDLAVLLQRANAAMIDAKNRGWGVASYEPDRSGEGSEGLNVFEALERHELEVHYQPQFSASTGELTGAEALVRWRHPHRGLLFPDVFLPFFEHAGLMSELTLEVLEAGAREHRAWCLDGLAIELSVNLAPSALLRDDLVGEIQAILARTGLAPTSLTLEITENVLLVDVERSLRALNELRATGVKLSLDDYGTGYCSLTYLRDLPLNEIKIDRSFVMKLVPGTPDAAIVASTIQLAQRLGLHTVAEGVETDTALGILNDLGCDDVQGYLLSRPITGEALRQLPRQPPVPRPRGNADQVVAPAP
jgi:diguanylate cyclase (GGDEF)-like protein